LHRFDPQAASDLHQQKFNQNVVPSGCANFNYIDFLSNINENKIDTSKTLNQSIQSDKDIKKQNENYSGFGSKIQKDKNSYIGAYLKVKKRSKLGKRKPNFSLNMLAISNFKKYLTHIVKFFFFF
jgi:hypothetical protein